MHVKTFFILATLCLFTGCQSFQRQTGGTAQTLTDYQKMAARFHSVISFPEFETTTNAIDSSVKKTIATANAALDHLGKLDPQKVTFENTIRALDDTSYQANLTANRLGLIKETSTNAAVRDAATEATKVLQEWAVGLDYR